MSENANDPRKSFEEPSFEDRLNAARSRRGLDAPTANGADKKAASQGGKPLSPVGVGMRVGVEMVSAVAVSVAIGWALDRWLHTRPAFLLVLVLFGGVAGVTNVWRLVKPPAAGKPE